jgi:hypothetical protein
MPNSMPRKGLNNVINSVAPEPARERCVTDEIEGVLMVSSADNATASSRASRRAVGGSTLIVAILSVF